MSHETTPETTPETVKLEDLVSKAREAWERVKRRPSRNLSDWLTIGEALMAGRAEAMRAAGTNKPAGRGYNTAFSKWLAAEKLDEIDQVSRSRLLLVMENREAVLAWHRTLTLPEQIRINNPQSVVNHWKKQTQLPKPKDPMATPKETQRDANFRLQEEVDQLRAENGQLKREAGQEWGSPSPPGPAQDKAEPPLSAKDRDKVRKAIEALSVKLEWENRAEVQRRVDEVTLAVRQQLDDREARLKEREERANQILNKHKGFIDEAKYKRLIKTIHPTAAEFLRLLPVDDEKSKRLIEDFIKDANEAERIFREELKPILVAPPPDPSKRRSRPLPQTSEPKPQWREKMEREARRAEQRDVKERAKAMAKKVMDTL